MSLLGCDRDRNRTKAVRETAGECVRLREMVRGGYVHVHVECVRVRAWGQRFDATRPLLLGTFTTILFFTLFGDFFLFFTKAKRESIAQEPKVTASFFHTILQFLH